MGTMSEKTTALLLSVGRFVLKRGEDMSSRRDLVSQINELNGDRLLDGIYINNVENYKIPDVSVIHLYSDLFAHWVLDPDEPNTCPFGYTIEVHERCFKKYTEEELAAAIIHDVLQNVYSDTAKIRFLKAYTEVTSKHDVDSLLDMFGDVNLSEVCFMAFTEICLRPFQVPVEGYDYVATDEVLKTMGLADAYDSYLAKALERSNDTPEERMEQELKDDYRDVNTIINACLDHDIRHYYNVVRGAVPLVTLEHILGGNDAMAGIGFRSRKMDRTRTVQRYREASALDESYNDPKDELEIRFQIDKLINAMRYAESEAEREVILFKIKQLSLKLAKAERMYSSSRRASDPRQKEKVKYLRDCMKELEDLRRKVMAMEIKVRRWSVYVKGQVPPEYDF